jgi:hypothetical protein
MFETSANPSTLLSVGASGSKDHERPKSHDQDSGLDLPSLSRPVPGASSPDNAVEEQPLSAAEPYSAQLTGVFILEFGVVFHSVFIGLTLAVAGKEFDTLYAVLAFHQTFEGLALGGRLASIDWPKTKRITPYFLAAGEFSLLVCLSYSSANAASKPMRKSLPVSENTISSRFAVAFFCLKR